GSPIEVVRDSCLVTGDHEIRWRRDGDFKRVARKFLEERHLAVRQFPGLLKLCSGDHGRTTFGTPAGAFPVEDNFLGDESVDSFSHIREPRPSAHLTISKNR